MSVTDRVSSGATRIGRLCTPASIVALVLCGVLMTGCEASPRAGSPPSEPRIVTREPLEAAVFLDAWARGDEETVDEMASPLYRAEWARRGLPPGGRRSLSPEGSPGGPLAFVGGVLDETGFGHYLYLATPEGRPPPEHPAPGVWRVDTDPSGGVVWAQRVWLFSGDTSVSTTVGGMTEQAALVPTPLQVLRPELLIRIASDTTQESYDVIRVGPASLPLETGSGGGILAFYGTNQAGAFIDGVWSYGQPIGGSRASGRHRHGSVPRVEAGSDDLEAAYLASLVPGS